MGCCQSKETKRRLSVRRRTWATEVVRASHILVKHTGVESKNLMSCRTNSAVVETATEARFAIDMLLLAIKSGNITFEEAATTKSDCSSFAKKGDLGEFGRGAMQKPFNDAVFAMNVGEMSGIVSTIHGLHIIKRTA